MKKASNKTLAGVGLAAAAGAAAVAMPVPAEASTTVYLAAPWGGTPTPAMGAGCSQNSGHLMRALQAILDYSKSYQAWTDYNIDGYYGDKTEAAIKDYQDSHPGLTVDGCVGYSTWTRMWNNTSFITTGFGIGGQIDYYTYQDNTSDPTMSWERRRNFCGDNKPRVVLEAHGADIVADQGWGAC